MPGDLGERRCGAMGHLGGCAVAARNGQCTQYRSRRGQQGESAHEKIMSATFSGCGSAP